jgi:hypothetical protein
MVKGSKQALAAGKKAAATRKANLLKAKRSAAAYKAAATRKANSRTRTTA